MATFDQLPADQKAIIELVLQRGQSYGDLSGMLGMPAARVKDLAREALSQLSPRTYDRVDAQWRGQLADYLLGQQTGPEATATRGHLKSSEPARAWANSLLDALDPLYPDAARPEIPEADSADPPVRRGRRERTERAERREPPRPRASAEARARPLSPEAERAVQRRRLVGGGIAALVAAGLIALLVVLISGGDDRKASSKDSSATKAAAAPVPLGQLAMKSVRGEKGEGQAVLVRADGKLNLVLEAQGLPANERGRGGKGGTAYEVWLYNSPKDAKSIGAQVTDAQGNYQGLGPLPKDFAKYKYIDLTREPIDENEGYSGKLVLRGKLDDVQAVDPAAAQQQAPQGQQQAPQGQVPQGQQAPQGQVPQGQQQAPQGQQQAPPGR